MTNFDLFINNNLLQRNFALFVFVIVLANLIFGGIILPYQQLQRAQAIWSSLAVQIPQWILDIVNNIYVAVQWVYNNAQAAISSAVALWNKANIILKEALKVAWNVLRKKLLNMLVNDILKWIQGGGTPRFVTDWQGFLKTAADKAAGAFLDELGAGFLCDGFSLQLRLALNTPPKFDEKATCTLKMAIANIDKFMADFSKGGWAGFIKISERKNNYMGAYFTALDQKYAVTAETEAAKKNEAISSSGFLGDTVCVAMENKTTNDKQAMDSKQGYAEADIPEGYKCTKWQTRTPGRIAGDALQQATGVDIENLISAKEFAEYAAAIIDAVINRAIKEGVAAMAPSAEGTSAGASGPGITTPATGSGVNISAYAEASTNIGAMETLIPQLRLFEENLDKFITEALINLGLLNDIKSTQLAVANALTSLLNAGCSPPPGATITTTATHIVSTCDGTVCPCDAVTVEDITASISGVGGSTIKKTTTTHWEDDDFTCTIDRVTVGYLTLSATAAIDTDITALNTKITQVQNQKSKVTPTITNTSNYEVAATTYMNVYEDWQKGNSAAATSTAETAMNTAKITAITYNQTLLSSTSIKFYDFNQETMDKSNDIATELTDLLNKRGGAIDCAYVTSMPVSLYKDLCVVKALLTSYINHSFCANWP